MKQFLKISPFITRRRFFTTDVERKLWDISTYKYLMPIQTRFVDNDAYSHVNYANYFHYMGLMMRSTIAMKIRDFDKRFNHVTARTECIYRKQMCFPDVLLAGAVYTKIGKSSSQLNIGLFSPKTSEDPYQFLSIGYRGSYAKDLNMEKVKELYEKEASVLASATNVLIDVETSKPVLKMPTDMSENFAKLMI